MNILKKNNDMTTTEGFILIGLFLLGFALNAGLHLCQIREWRKQDKKRFDSYRKSKTE